MISSSHFFNKTLFGNEDQNIENSTQQVAELGPWYKKKPICLMHKRYKTEEKSVRLENSQNKSKKSLQKSRDQVKINKKQKTNQVILKPLKVKKYSEMEVKKQDTNENRKIERKLSRIPIFREFNFLNSVQARKKHHAHLNYWHQLKANKLAIQNRIISKNILLFLPQK